MPYCVGLVCLSKQYQARSHAEVIYEVCGRPLGKVINLLISIFLFAVIVVMFAGGGSHLTKVGLSALQGSLLIACLTSVIVTLKIEWVLAFISGATPCIALIVFYISEHSMTSTSYQAVDIANAIASIQPVGKNWVHSALLYASFCIFAGAPFLIILCGNSSTKSNCVARQHLGRAWVFMLAIAHSKHTAPRIEYHFIK